MSFNVFIVDDSEIARKLLIRILAEDPELQIVGEAETGLAGVMFLEEKKPDIIMLESDISGGMRLNDVITEVKKFNPMIKVVLCVNPQATRMIIPASEVGADQFVTKPYIKRRVLSAMKEMKEQIMAGRERADK